MLTQVIVSDLAVIPKIKNMAMLEVRQKILYMDDAFCTDIFLSNLLAFAPTNDDDLKTMEIYMKKTPEECEELDLPEQLTIEVKLQAVKWSISGCFFFMY